MYGGVSYGGAAYGGSSSFTATSSVKGYGKPTNGPKFGAKTESA